MSSDRYGLSCNYISSTNEIIMVGGAKIAVNGSCGITYRKEVEIFNLDSGTIRNGELKMLKSKISSNKKKYKCHLCDSIPRSSKYIVPPSNTPSYLTNKVQSYQNVFFP